jgi:hypothetical protein
MASIIARRKKKLSLNTIMREFILVNRHKQNRFDHAFDYKSNDINYNRKAVVNLLMAETPDGNYLEIGCTNNDLFDAVMAGREATLNDAVLRTIM